jgi:RHS repeat-associated protein
MVGFSLPCTSIDVEGSQVYVKRRLTGLDYFGARYFSGAQGRFTSPDPVGGDLANPQSLNRYTYVLNNPLRFTDPTGLYTCRDTKDGSCTSDQDIAFEKALDALRGKNGDVARSAAAYEINKSMLQPAAAPRFHLAST